ncbi:universal stress protein [Amycolatopsis sp. CA-230715]|uniref:universal stress protein n=1 Tax=Amycolatopsis sp. CA-230715 TaxID=2745196 RepID=UPI001C03207E|nr:universal stress protein [Amycolatopsis sp. CA-230715]QWF78005.1 Universal stress protein [Amycolatopsis sp. CA-230715]
MSDHTYVVGVDGTPGALRAVRWAAAMAGQRERGLRLVHVVDDVTLRYPRPMPMREDPGAVLRARGHRLLRQARDAAAEFAPQLSVSLTLVTATVVSGLLSACREADLLVLGTGELRPLGRVLLGSTSIAVAVHAACPVALVRTHLAEDFPPSDGPVAVAVDDSPSSDEAVAIAFDEASWRATGLVAVHSRSRFGAEGGEDAIERRLAGWREKYPDVPVDLVVDGRSPAELVLDRADRAQLVVVGSRGRGEFTGMLLGSTSQTVMSYALCPVIVAKGRENG